ncbi:MAG: signal peptidase I [Eubacteriales bacterium]|nr:signal peptidase I [Eubacteriales bacterium]
MRKLKNNEHVDSEVSDTKTAADFVIKEETKKPTIKQTIWEYVKMIITVIVIVFVINNVILINARIPSASMEQTIMTGDRVFGFRLSYGINWNLFGKQISKQYSDPQRYDIVIFRYPDDESQLFIKRLIGLPGDTLVISKGKVYVMNDFKDTDKLEMDPKTRELYVNGEVYELNEEDALDDSFCHELPNGRGDGIYHVPEDCYFMMGDNRNNSHDSRFWENKYVRFDQLVGKAMFRYFPTPKLLTAKYED